MAIYGVDFYGVGKYGPRVFLEFDAGPLIASDRGLYGQLFLSWSTPGGSWSRLRLVRNAFGIPVTHDDGTVLLDSASGPGEPLGTRAPAVRSFLDQNLEPGRFQYYAVWLYSTTTSEWVRAAATTGLVLKDHGYSERLWELTPSIYRTQTTGLLDSDNETLRTFERVIGTQLDHLRTEYETLRSVNDPDRVSGNLLPLMAQQYGQFFEPELGMKQMRQLLRNTVSLYRNKGTVPGIEGFISAVSGYGSEIQPLKNLMLDYNDSSFEEGIGNWYSPNATLSRYVADGSISGAPVAIGSTMRSAGLLRAVSTATAVVLQGIPSGGSGVSYGIPVTAGQAYSFSFYTRASTVARGVVGEVWWYDKNGTYMSSTAGTSATNTVGTWTRNIGAANRVAPANAVYAVPVIRMATTAVNEVHYYDALQFEPGTVATDYEDARLLDIDVLAPRVNHIPNPSFETDTTGWTGAAYRNLLTANQSSWETDTVGAFTSVNSTIARSTAQALDGTASLAATATAAGDWSIRVGAASSYWIPVVAGQVYTVVASARAAATPRRMQIGLRYYNDALTQLAASPLHDQADNTTGWTQLYNTSQAPAGATRAAIYIYGYGSAAGEVHYVDAVGVFPDPQGNLVNNSDFKNGIGGWVPYGTSTTAASTAQAFTGRQSMLVTAGSSGQYGGGAQLTSLPTVPGTTYTLSAWLYVVPGGEDAGFGVRAASVGSGNAVTTPGVWERSVYTWTETAASRTLYVGMATSTNTDVGDQVYVDAVSVTATTGAVDYVPPQTHNHILNPGPVGAGSSNQTGSTGGTASDGTDSAVPSGVYHRRTGASGYGFNSDFLAPGVYTLSQWWRSSDTRTATLYFEGSATLSGGSSQGSFPLTAGVWTKIVKTFTVLTGGSIRGSFLTTVTAGHTFDISSVKIEQGYAATPYVSGSAGPGYKWNASENLIANGSFETDTAGWEGLNKNLLTANQSSVETDATGWNNYGNTNYARSTAQALDGTASLSMTAQAAGNMSVRTALASSPTSSTVHEVIPGQVYTAVAHFRAATTARSVYVDIAWRMADGTHVAFSGVSVVSDNTAGWTQARITAMAPATATHCFVIPTVQSAAIGEVHYVDGVGLFETPNGNLTLNPDFENGTAGWEPSTSTIASSTAQSRTGRSSLAITSSAGGLASAFVTVGAASGVNAGKTYTVSAYFLPGGVARTVRVELQWLNEASAEMGARAISATTQTVVGAWTRVAVTGIAPTGATRLRTLIRVDGTVAGEVMYLDSVQIVAGDTALEYLPPTTSNLIPNPSFEVDLAGWSGGAAATRTRTTTDKYVGTAAGQTVVTNASVSAGGLHDYGWYRDLWEVGPEAHTLSAYIKGPAGRQIGLRAVRMIGGVTQYGTSPTDVNVFVTATGAWQLVSVYCPPVSNAYGMHIRAGQNSGSGAVVNDTTYVDAVQLEVGSVATPYVDGSLGAGYKWDASENLLTAAQSSFEDGTTGSWNNNGSGTTISNATDQAYVGTRSLYVVPATHSWGYVNLSPGTGATRLIAGQTYTFSAYVRSTTTQTLAIREYGNSTTGGNYGPSLVVAANTWTRLTFTKTLSDSTTTVYFQVTRPDGTPPDAFHIDAIQVEQRSFPTAYAAPGTAHASTSTRQQPWVLGGTSIESLTRQAGGVGSGLVGTWSLRTEATVGQNYRGGDVGSQTIVAVAPNTTYTVSGYPEPSGVSTLEWRVVDRSDAQVLVTTGSMTSNATRRALTFTTKSATTAVAIQLVRLQPSTRTDGYVGNIDAVQLEQRPFATAYAATGAANASTSTRQMPWTQGGTGATTLTRVTDVSYERAASLSVAHTEGIGSGAATDVVLEPLTTYTLSAYVRTPVGEVPPLLQVTTTGGVVVAAGAAATTFGDWERISLTFTTTSATAYTVGVVASASTNVSHNFWLDAVLLERSNALQPYFDGMTYAFTGDTLWEGAAELSRSHLYPLRRTKNYRMAALLPEYTPMGSSFRLNYAQPL